MHVCNRTIIGLPVLVCLFASMLAHPLWAQSEALTRNFQRGSSLFEAGMYKASTTYFVKALELSETEYGRDSSRTAFILKNLATVYAKQGMFDEAEPFYIRALRVFEDAFGPDHGLVAEVTNELSIVFVERKRFIEAEPLLVRVLENLERTFGPDDPRVAVAAYNSGYASEYLGDASKARTFYARALLIWQSQPVPDDDRIRAAQERLTGLSRVKETKGPSLAPYLPRVLPGNAPKTPEPPVPEKSNKTPELEKKPVPTPTPAVTSWRVQLAAFRSRAAADKESKRLQWALASLLQAAGGLKVAEAVLPKGTFYRVIAGPYAERSSAVAVCRKIKAEYQPCIVARQK